MRRLFVLTAILCSAVFGSAVAFAGNQEEADRIAKMLGDQFPQYNIEVAYQEGKVRLRGEVGSEAERDAVTQMVRQIPKVRSVQETFSIVSRLDQEQEPVAVVHQPVQIPSAVVQRPVDQNVRPVSALRADEPLLIAQTTVSDQTYLSEAVTAPTVVENGGYYSTTMPMGTVIEGGAPVVQGNMAQGEYVQGVNTQGNYAQVNYPAATRGPSEYMAPQGQSLTQGQSGQPNLPNYAWPTTSDYPNYSQVSYPKQYASGAFPYIGPFYPYPQVPLGWRKVTMEWHDGYWWLDFNDGSASGPFSPLFRQSNQYR